MSRRMLPVAVLAAALIGVGLQASLGNRPALAEAAKLGTNHELQRWRDEIAKARDRVRAAQAELIEAERAYGDMRHRDRRGATRGQTVARLDAAKKELAAAEAALPEVVEKARRAGLPPGDFRELDLD